MILDPRSSAPPASDSIQAKVSKISNRRAALELFLVLVVANSILFLGWVAAVAWEGEVAGWRQALTWTVLATMGYCLLLFLWMSILTGIRVIWSKR